MFQMLKISTQDIEVLLTGNLLYLPGLNGSLEKSRKKDQPDFCKNLSQTFCDLVGIAFNLQSDVYWCIS